MAEIVRFAVERVEILRPDGTLAAPLPDWAEAAEELVRLYRAMVLTRTYDTKSVNLQRTGRLGTVASSLGQEALAVGTAAAMRPEDVLLPSFREQGAMLWRGVRIEELLTFWGGDERGSHWSGPREDFPICVPVGTHAPHAAGVATAFKLRREPRVAVCVLGDGATSKGDVYEAWNLAGVWRLPMVTVVNNNQWAISVPRSAQTAAETLAQKAIACGMPGIQVDGNDVIAVREVVGRAIERARSGEGPALVEATTYRLSDHTTADDARRYRDDAEVSARWKEEPIARLRTFLVARGAWDKDREEKLLAECGREVDRAVEACLARTPPAATEMIDHVFAGLPRAMAAQRAAIARRATERAEARAENGSGRP
jgi:pyruvate dehydrogenase E1 component alpha subunit